MPKTNTIEKYLKDGNVYFWPSKKEARDVIFAYLSREFEKGKKYSERQVNEILEPMKKIIALVVLCSIGLTVGVAYFYVQRASELPDWYTDKPAPAQPAPTPSSSLTAPPPRTATAIQEKN